MRVIVCLLLTLLILGYGGKVVPIHSESEVQRGTREAERDAKKDVSKTKWFGLGLAGGCVGFLGAAISTNAFDSGDLDISLWTSLSLIGLSGPACAALLHTPVVPPERFLGKSPDYINTYGQIYRRDVKRQRTTYAATGYLTGCLGSIAIATVVGLAVVGAVE